VPLGMSGPRVGRYDILTTLTKGGMAELSLASTAGPGGFKKFVVLKRILPEAAGDENFVKMFLDEARVTGAFSHPSICQVFELGKDEQAGLFVAMEFIAGQDLNQVVSACARQQAVLPLGFSASVVHDCALALHYAHTFKLPSGVDSPVIHRDVAQKNIMVTYDGQTKLLDFGIAKAKGALAHTRVGTVKGTAGYMSPEQVRGEPIDGRSDVFSLGVVLWEMITGRRLFSSETELSELKMILSEPIAPPHEVEASVPPELAAVAMKALDRDKNQRYRSAREMARALSSQCSHLLFDAEERADFMRQRFAEKIDSTKRLFEAAASSLDSEMDAAVEDYRRSTEAHDAVPARKPKRLISGSRLKGVRGGSFSRLSSDQDTSATKLKKVRVKSESAPEETSEGSATVAMSELEHAQGRPGASKVWPMVAVVFALSVGLVVWKAMQGPPQYVPPVRGASDIPGVDTTAKDDEPPKPDVKIPDAAIVKTEPSPSTSPRAKGEVLLVLIPEATVSKGNQRLGQGSMVNVALPVGTHLVTVVGEDGIKHKLSLQIASGKNKAQRFRLEDLPVQ
jgi:eukaryotic-like serine/threonine-protein kinase